MLLKKLLQEGCGDGKNLNCAERMLYCANEAYELGITAETLKAAGCFGGGMAVESVCGALTGCLMALGCVMVEDCAHATPQIRERTREFHASFARKLGAVDCTPLKQMYRTEKTGCASVLYAAADTLDGLMIQMGGLDPVSGERKRA